MLILMRGLCEGCSGHREDLHTTAKQKTKRISLTFFFLISIVLDRVYSFY